MPLIFDEKKVSVAPGLDVPSVSSIQNADTDIEAPVENAPEEGGITEVDLLPGPSGESKPIQPTPSSTTKEVEKFEGGDIADERIEKFNDIINEASDLYKVDSEFVKSVIKQESRGKEGLTSPAGAKGLMQLMDATAKGLRVADSFDNRQNIFGGTKLLAQLLKRYKGDKRAALVAYNAGPKWADRFGGDPPKSFSNPRKDPKGGETYRYVKRISADYNRKRPGEIRLTEEEKKQRKLVFDQATNEPPSNSQVQETPEIIDPPAKDTVLPFKEAPEGLPDSIFTPEALARAKKTDSIKNEREGDIPLDSLVAEPVKNKELSALFEGIKSIARAPFSLVKGISLMSEKGSEKEKKFWEDEAAKLRKKAETEKDPQQKKMHLRLAGMWDDAATKTIDDKAFFRDLGKSSGKIASKFKANPNFKKSAGVRGYVQDVIMMSPQIASQVVVTGVTGGAGGIVFMASQIAGSKTESLIEDGIEPERAVAAAFADAALQAPLEQIGLSKAMKLWKGEAKNVFKDIFSAGATEFVTEALQAYPEAITEIWAKTEGKSNSARLTEFWGDFWNITKNGLYQGLVAFPLGAAGGGAGVLVQKRAEKKQKKQKERVEKLRKLIFDNEKVLKGKKGDDELKRGFGEFIPKSKPLVSHYVGKGERVPAGFEPTGEVKRIDGKNKLEFIPGDALLEEKNPKALMERLTEKSDKLGTIVANENLEEKAESTPEEITEEEDAILTEWNVTNQKIQSLEGKTEREDQVLLKDLAELTKDAEVIDPDLVDNLAPEEDVETQPVEEGLETEASLESTGKESKESEEQRDIRADKTRELTLAIKENEETISEEEERELNLLRKLDKERQKSRKDKVQEEPVQAGPDEQVPLQTEAPPEAAPVTDHEVDVTTQVPVDQLGNEELVKEYKNVSNSIDQLFIEVDDIKERASEQQDFLPPEAIEEIEENIAERNTQINELEQKSRSLIEQYFGKPFSEINEKELDNVFITPSRDEEDRNLAIASGALDPEIESVQANLNNTRDLADDFAIDLPPEAPEGVLYRGVQLGGRLPSERSDMIFLTKDLNVAETYALSRNDFNVEVAEGKSGAIEGLNWLVKNPKAIKQFKQPKESEVLDLTRSENREIFKELEEEQYQHLATDDDSRFSFLFWGETVNYRPEYWNPIIKLLKEKGYKGIKYNDDIQTGITYAVFPESTEEIKTRVKRKRISKKSTEKIAPNTRKAKAGKEIAVINPLTEKYNEIQKKEIAVKKLRKDHIENNRIRNNSLKNREEGQSGTGISERAFNETNKEKKAKLKLEEQKIIRENIASELDERRNLKKAEKELNELKGEFDSLEGSKEFLEEKKPKRPDLQEDKKETNLNLGDKESRRLQGLIDQVDQIVSPRYRTTEKGTSERRKTIKRRLKNEILKRNENKDKTYESLKDALERLEVFEDTPEGTKDNRDRPAKNDTLAGFGTAEDRSLKGNAKKAIDQVKKDLNDGKITEDEAVKRADDIASEHVRAVESQRKTIKKFKDMSVEERAAFIKSKEGKKIFNKPGELLQQLNNILNEEVDYIIKGVKKGKRLSGIFSERNEAQEEAQAEYNEKLSEIRNLNKEQKKDINLRIKLNEELEGLSQALVGKIALPKLGKGETNATEKALDAEISNATAFNKSDFPLLATISKLTKALAEGHFNNQIAIKKKAESFLKVLQDRAVEEGFTTQEEVKSAENDYKQKLRDTPKGRLEKKEQAEIDKLIVKGAKDTTFEQREKTKKSIAFHKDRLEKIKLGFNPNLNIPATELSEMNRLNDEIKALEKRSKDKNNTENKVILGARIISKQTKLGRLFRDVDDRFSEQKKNMSGKESYKLLKWMKAMHKDQNGFISFGMKNDGDPSPMLSGENWKAFHNMAKKFEKLFKNTKRNARKLVGEEIDFLVGRKQVMNLDTQKKVHELIRDLTEKERGVLMFLMEGEETIPSGKNFDGTELQKELDEIKADPERLKKLRKAALKIKKHNDALWDIIRKDSDKLSNEQIKNYVAHIWGRRGKMTEEQLGEMVKFMTENKSLKNRTLATYRKGIELGLTPRFTDIAKIMDVNTQVGLQVGLNNALIKMLEGGNKKGFTLMADANEATDKLGWLRLSEVGVEIAGLRDKAIDPSVEPVINAFFKDKRRGKIIGAFEFVSGVRKKMSLTFSLFHHYVIGVESALGTQGLIFGKNSSLKRLTNIKAMWKAANKGAYSVIAEKWDVVKEGVEAGLQVGEISDVQVERLDQVLEFSQDMTKNIFGEKASKATFGLLRATNKAWDRVLWDYLHTTMKIDGYQHLSNKMVSELDNPTAEDIQIVRREAARVINDTFGGQNWQGMLTNPKTLQIFQALMLSPDWTVSTFKQTLAPFGIMSATKTKAGRIARAKMGAKFWANAGIKYGIALNLLNVAFRLRDKDEDWEEEIVQLENTIRERELAVSQTNYLSKYRGRKRLAKKMMEKQEKNITAMKAKLKELKKNKPSSFLGFSAPESREELWGMTMFGNTIGHRTEVYLGSTRVFNEEKGKWEKRERFFGPGKQFLDTFELFIRFKTPNGARFDEPHKALPEKLAGKGNQLLQDVTFLGTGMYAALSDSDERVAPARGLQGVVKSLIGEKVPIYDKELEKARGRGTSDYLKELSWAFTKKLPPFLAQSLIRSHEDLKPLDAPLLAMPRRSGPSKFTIKEGVSHILHNMKRSGSGNRTKFLKNLDAQRIASERNDVNFDEILWKTFDSLIKTTNNAIDKAQTDLSILEGEEDPNKKDIEAKKEDIAKGLYWVNSLHTGQEILDEVIARGDRAF